MWTTSNVNDAGLRMGEIEKESFVKNAVLSESQSLEIMSF